MGCMGGWARRMGGGSRKAWHGTPQPFFSSDQKVHDGGQTLGRHLHGDLTWCGFPPRRSIPFPLQVSIFEGACYTTPLLGAVFADSMWGRYKTILVFSIIYLVVRMPPV